MVPVLHCCQKLNIFRPAAAMLGDWIALAQVLMNMVPRDSLGSSQYYGDEDSDVSPFFKSNSILCKKLGTCIGAYT